MSETALLPREETLPERNGGSAAPVQVAGVDVMTLGRLLAQSGYFKDARDQAQAVVKILYGQELGVGPVSSMMGIHIIEGKPSPSANLLAAVVKRSRRYDYRIIERTDQRCEIAFFDRSQELGRVAWTIADATRANLAGKKNWKEYPRAMLFGRAMSEGARVYCPELFGGAPVYTPEELGAEIDPQSGDPLPAPDPQAAKAQAGRRLFAVAKEAGMDTKNAPLMREVAGRALHREVAHIAQLSAEERNAVADWIVAGCPSPEAVIDPLDEFDGEDEPFTDATREAVEAGEQGTYSGQLIQG